MNELDSLYDQLQNLIMNKKNEVDTRYTETKKEFEDKTITIGVLVWIIRIFRYLCHIVSGVVIVTGLLMLIFDPSELVDPIGISWKFLLANGVFSIPKIVETIFFKFKALRSVNKEIKELRKRIKENEKDINLLEKTRDIVEIKEKEAKRVDPYIQTICDDMLLIVNLKYPNFEQDLNVLYQLAISYIGEKKKSVGLTPSTEYIRRLAEVELNIERNQSIISGENANLEALEEVEKAIIAQLPGFKLSGESRTI